MHTFTNFLEYEHTGFPVNKNSDIYLVNNVKTI